tara:strand:- start:256 stop:489 length:234 start_codon:yes stop_codon:yes gene_type:complete
VNGKKPKTYYKKNDMSKKIEVSPCCKAEFEEAEGSACCNAEISESGICMNRDCYEHAESEGYFCNECDESFEKPIVI